MYGFIKKDVLKTFVLMSLFFGLNRALEEGDAKTPEAVGVTDVKKEFSIIAPKNDKRTYSVNVCENGVEVVLINDPDDRNIVLKAVIGWGKGCGKGNSTCQFDGFLHNQEKKTYPASHVKQYRPLPYISINDECTCLTFNSRNKNHLKSDIAQFFEFFNIKKEIESSDTDVSRVLDRILDDDEVSFEDLNIFFKEVFLRSKITLFVCGNIKKEEAEQIFQEAAKIRSKQERVVSAKEIEARKLHFIDQIRSSLDYFYMPPGYSFRMAFIPYGASPFQKNSAEAIGNILKNKIADKFLEYIETVYPDVECEFSLLEFKYSNGLVSALFGFFMTLPSGDCPDEGIHSEMLKAFFSHLREAKVSEDDYRKYVESMKERFESEAHQYGYFGAINTISEASVTFRLPVKNYLNHPYEFEDLKSDEINNMLQIFSNIENWTIAVSGNYNRKLSKEDISEIKDKINQPSENPSTNQGVRN